MKYYAYKSSTRIALNRTRTRVIKIDLFTQSVHATRHLYDFPKDMSDGGWIEISKEQFTRDLRKITKHYSL